MNAFGIIAGVAFVLAWLGAVVSWFFAAYHLVLFFVIAVRQMGLKSAFEFNWPPPLFTSNLPDRCIMHRRQFVRGAVAFVCCWLVGMLAAGLGTSLGG